MRDAPSQRGGIVEQLPSGTQLTNLGCEENDSGIWCDVQSVLGGPRGYVTHRYLEPAVGPDGPVPTGWDQSAYRAGKGDFDATGEIPCAQFESQPMTRCVFRVARSGGGYATMVIVKPDSEERMLFFSLGIPTGVSSSQADIAGPLRSDKIGDLHFINVGKERYEIPHAAVVGG